MRVLTDGNVEVIDPGFDTLPLLQEIDPRFSVLSVPLPRFERPRFMDANRAGVGVAKIDATQMTLDELNHLHQKKLVELRAGRKVLPPACEKEASLLQLKALIARRLLAACALCARRCGVNRLGGQIGPCGLGERAFVAEHFVHIAEEAPINPSLLLSLRGCGLRCRFCQQHEILDAQGRRGEALEKTFWRRIDVKGARSLSFVGGNPDESLHAALDFLTHAPSDFSLPVVWNHHAYGTKEVVDLLDHVVDAYIPDLKYGNDECAARLSGVKGYCAAAQCVIQRQLTQGVPVFVRILVLPGHFECCHRPALQFLASLPQRDLLFVSVRGQYAPDWKITAADGPLARRTSTAESRQVRHEASDLGLNVV